MSLKHCPTCEKDLVLGFFNATTGDECIFCFDKHTKVELVPVKKSQDYEEVEDNGCASGACTL